MIQKRTVHHQPVHVAFTQSMRNKVSLQGEDGDICGTLIAQVSIKLQTFLASFTPMASNECGCKETQTSCAIRRLTPKEYERLQGFPDDYTLVPYRRPFAHLPKFILDRSYKRYLHRMQKQKKIALPLDELIKCADGNRYKALGNSMAVPCMHWIGKRILLEHFRERS